MLDLSYQGREFPSYQFEVDRAKIKELCLAIGDNNPLFFDREYAQSQGYQDTPADICDSLKLWGYPEIWSRMTEMGIDTARLLHAKEEYEYFAPIYPGDIITGTVVVDSMRDPTAMQMVTFKSVYTARAKLRLLLK